MSQNEAINNQRVHPYIKECHYEKKISNILLAATFTLPLFTACETDNDSNPILNEPDTFTLNTPAYAANNVYDLKNAQTVELTCSQPDYGFPAATTYGTSFI